MEFKEFEPRFKSWNIWYYFKWNQPYLSRGLNLNRRSNSLNSAIGPVPWIPPGKMDPVQKPDTLLEDLQFV